MSAAASVSVLKSGAPLVGDLTAAIDNITTGIRVAVKDQAGQEYIVSSVVYDAASQVLALVIDTSAPVVISPPAPLT